MGISVFVLTLSLLMIYKIRNAKPGKWLSVFIIKHRPDQTFERYKVPFRSSAATSWKHCGFMRLVLNKGEDGIDHENHAFQKGRSAQVRVVQCACACE